jgi:hypothetical protein
VAKSVKKHPLREIFSFYEPQRCFILVFFSAKMKPRGGVSCDLWEPILMGITPQDLLDIF